MGSFGERLRRERDMRGITLGAVSGITKIRTHILEALENEEFDKLPGGIFNKGFVRSYARFLGMNEEQVLKEFIELAGDPEQPLPDPPVPRRKEMRHKKRRSWGGVATVVVCAIALLYGGWRTARVVRRPAGAGWSGVHRPGSRPAMTTAETVAAHNASSSSSRRDEQPAVPATAQPENAAPTGLQLTSQRSTTPAPELVPAAATTRAERLVIVVTANQPAWVSITADGKPLLEGVLERRKKIRADSEVVLKTNNAGALVVSRNGKRLPPLGDQDQQTTVIFTPESVTYSPAVSGETREADPEGLPDHGAGPCLPDRGLAGRGPRDRGLTLAGRSLALVPSRE